MAPITMRDLEGVLRRINRAVSVDPDSPICEEGADGVFRWTVGRYRIDGAYGGWELQQVTNDRGGVRVVIDSGHCPKRELYGLMHAYARGLEEAVIS